MKTASRPVVRAAGALDQAPTDRSLSREAVVERSGRPSRECREALRALRDDHLVVEMAGCYQLTIAGFGAVTEIIDVTGVLAANEPGIG